MKLAPLIFTLWLMIPLCSSAQYNFPGGIVELVLTKQSSELPDIKYGLRDPVIIEQPEKWRILIGIGLDTLPGEYLLYVKRATEDSPGEHRKITVQHIDYPLIDMAQDTNSSKANLALVRQHKRMSEIDFTNTQQPSLPLQMPIKGQWSDTFGHKVFDPIEKKLQSVNAVSFTTTELAAVTSPQNAIVTRVVLDAQGVSTVFLDHGRGLYSVIAGLKDTTVEAGDGVVAGAMIGKLSANPSADTAQPATLIWQVAVNDVFVNPLILTQLKP